MINRPQTARGTEQWRKGRAGARARLIPVNIAHANSIALVTGQNKISSAIGGASKVFGRAQSRVRSVVFARQTKDQLTCRRESGVDSRGGTRRAVERTDL